MDTNSYSDDRLIGALRGCADVHGSEEMKKELRAAADRLDELSKRCGPKCSEELLGLAFDQALFEVTGSVLSSYAASMIRKRANAIVDILDATNCSEDK